MTSNDASAIAALVDELADLFRRLDRPDAAARPDALDDPNAAARPDALDDLDAPASPDALTDPDAFNTLALRVHAAQRASNPMLRRFWDTAPGGEPSSWETIPPVPVAAFKDLPIIAGIPEAVFRTSGTTGREGRRGEHHVVSLDLYRAAARGNYRRHLLNGVQAVRVVSLIPSPDDVSDSSLSAMAGFIAGEPEVTGTTWAFHPERGASVSVVGEAATAGEPILLLTTAFALVHLLDALGRDRIPFPEGSRVMETGGFKGRVTEISRGALYRRAEQALDIPRSHIVNEYGMTELLSQAYDGAAGATSPTRPHRFPPWVRTRALDPTTLKPLPPGEPGLLAHFDLANAGSVCHVLTEDFGHTTADGGLHLIGRAPGASLRGCSLVAESFMRATRQAAGPRRIR